MIINSYILEETVDSSVIVSTCGNLLFQFITFVMIHICTTYIGKLFVEVGMLRTGNEALLNNLSEGLVIVDREDKSILFANDAAKFFNK